MATKDKKSLKIGDWAGLFLKQTKTKKITWLSLAAAGLLALLYLVYSLLYLGQVYPHSYIGSYSFSRLDSTQVQDKIATLAQNAQNTQITLTLADKTYTLNPSDVSYSLDVNQTTQEIVNRGRSRGAWHSFVDQMSALFARHNFQPVYSYDPNSLDQYVSTVAGAVDQPAADASAKFVSDSLTITSEKAGQVLDQGKVKASIIGAWNSLNPSPITLTLKTDSPKVVADTQDNLRAEVDKLSQSQLTLTWAGGKKTFAAKDIRSLIGFVGGAPAGSNPAQKVLAAQFTAGSITSYLDSFATAQNIDQPAQDPKLVINDGVLAVSQASQKGSVVDRDASAALILAALANNSDQPVALVMKDQQPVITEDKLNSLGIKELIGTGTTSFARSPANRISNIANGVRLLHSALIAPGAEFSTIKTLGAVDGTTGFLPELVIKDDRTIPEFGGGLCQVSTTLFRAVLNAGLKVTERQNHSYRVSYYEPPIGLDATIYLPKPDFKFLNDTPGYILIQGKIVGNKITFELWGSGDGRTSAISDPVVSNITDPGDPLYTNTDTLDVGVTKQTEKPHQGATAVVNYTVTRAGTVINKQTFKSVYKALPAQFLVGTRPVPTPPPPDTPPA
ncbi:MAG TPA: VanW family protein [Candidatus Saccharimonadales bacterium]|nr:VanW family protein [Candidatus Saccharimonadales bacterium]